MDKKSKFKFLYSREEVYFPSGSTWFNYFTKDAVKGESKHVKVAYTLNTFPLFIKAGSIIALNAFTGYF